MVASYSGNPADSDKDEIRFLTGDTDAAPASSSPNPILQDEEHQFLIDEAGSVAYAAPRAATSMAAKFARFVNVKTGQVSKNLSDQMQHFLDLAKRLQQRADEGAAGVAAGEPIFTALTKSDKRVDRQDPDLVQPTFHIGQDDNPRTARREDLFLSDVPNP